MWKHSFGFGGRHGEPADGHGSQHAVPAGLPEPPRGGAGSGLIWKNLPAVPAQAEGVCENHPHQGLQHGEDQGPRGGVPLHKLPGVGRGRTGEAAPAVEVLHAADRRDRVCGGLHGTGAHGGGQGGAAQDHPHLGEPGRPGADPGQQAGPGLGDVRRRGGEAAVRPGAQHVHAAPRAELQRRGRSGTAGRLGETLRDDPKEEEDGEAQQEPEKMKLISLCGLHLNRIVGTLSLLEGEQSVPTKQKGKDLLLILKQYY